MASGIPARMMNFHYFVYEGSINMDKRLGWPFLIGSEMLKWMSKCRFAPSTYK